MKEDRTAFWFRIRVILSTLLVLLGAGLFFAGYYDGRLSAGAVKTDGSPSEISCDMHIEYLDGKVWRRLGKTEHISGKTNDFGKFELTEDITLDSGHYRAVFTDDDLFAAAGFTVR